MRQFRSHSTARGRTAHLAAFFGRDARAATLTTYQIRQYQLTRRAAGAATGTINRETSALHRMGTLAVHWGWLDTVPGFPARLLAPTLRGVPRKTRREVLRWAVWRQSGTVFARSSIATPGLSFRRVARRRCTTVHQRHT